MVVQVSPSHYNVSETLCSLQFAQRTRTVELNTTKNQNATTPKKEITKKEIIVNNNKKDSIKVNTSVKKNK